MTVSEEESESEAQRALSPSENQNTESWVELEAQRNRKDQKSLFFLIPLLSQGAWNHKQKE